MQRRLLHEWQTVHPQMIKKKPELLRLSYRGVLKLYIEKCGGEEEALKKLIKINGTEDVHTVFCEHCGFRVGEVEEKSGMLRRGRVLCWKHQCELVLK